MDLRATRTQLAAAVSVLAMTGAACSGAATDEIAAVDPGALAFTEAIPESGVASPVAVPAEPRAVEDVEADLARFLAAANFVLRGTNLEAEILAAPQTYVGLGQLACVDMAAGSTVEQVVSTHLESATDEERADEARLIGAVLGAAVETICPDQADKLS
jgi:hypothetical protein